MPAIIGAGVFFLFATVPLYVLVFFLPFAGKNILIIPLSLYCLYTAWEFIAAYIGQSQKITISSRAITIGNVTDTWNDLREWDLAATRSWGIGSERTKQLKETAVLVFGDEREVRIHYHLYSNREDLRRQLERAVAGAVPASAVIAAAAGGGTMVCPRCQGKGYVDHNDIERMRKTAVWRPGSCMLCHATGIIGQ